MDQLRTCIRQIIELRELEKSESEGQKSEYMASDSETDSNATDSDEITKRDSINLSDQKYCGAPSNMVKCRDDKYFDAIDKVIEMPPKDDIYGEYGKYIASQLRSVAKTISVVRAYEMMKNIQENISHQVQNTIADEDDSIVPD